MKKIYIYMAFVAAVSTACNKIESEPIQNEDEPIVEVKMITETVTGGRGTSSKATIADSNASFKWTTGDHIAVHVSNADSHKYVFTSDEGASGASTAAASASFTVVYEEGYSRDAFAVYPSTIVAANAANYGQSGTELDVTLPASYMLAQVSGETSPCPMIATNTAGSGWDFYQLCGLLRLTVSNIPPTAKRLEIDFNGRKVCGDFSIASPVVPNNSVIATTDDDSHDTITIVKDGSDMTLYSGWGDGKVFNIPLPTGSYTNITVTAYDALIGGNALPTITRDFTYTASNLRAKRKTISLPVFSTMDNKNERVSFAPGNLQATYNTATQQWTWSFASNQYDYIGNAGGNTIITTNLKESTEPYAKLSDNGTVDLFGRSTVDTFYGICKSTNINDYNNTFVDWGAVSTFEYRGVSTTYPSTYWRTFNTSSDVDSYNGTNEWAYIMNRRASGATVNGTSNARFTKAAITISDSPSTVVNGMILFPDGYDGSTPDGVTWGTINGQSSGWVTSCTKAGWEALELAGCVFIPAAGYRYGTSVSNVNTRGYYWGQNLRYSGCSYILQFFDGNIYWNWDDVKHDHQLSVRLVHEF